MIKISYRSKALERPQNIPFGKLVVKPYCKSLQYNNKTGSLVYKRHYKASEIQVLNQKLKVELLKNFSQFFSFFQLLYNQISIKQTLLGKLQVNSEA